MRIVDILKLRVAGLVIAFKNGISNVTTFFRAGVTRSHRGHACVEFGFDR